MSTMLPTTCAICNCECGLLAEVQNGRIVQVTGDPQNPHNCGMLCPKGKLSAAWRLSADRLTHPLLRNRKSQCLAPVSWDEALDFLADRLVRIKEQHGPAAVGFYYGANPNFLSRVFYDALARWFGSPNSMGTWSLCVGPKVLGYESVMGRTANFPRADFLNSRLIVLWGANPAETAMHRYWRLWPDILAARKKGARLTVIDPRPTRTARAADRHLAIRSGTDHLLAVALIQLLLERDLVDHDYLARHAEGLERLEAALAGFDTRAAVAQTGLDWKAVQALAQDLGTVRPAVVDRREGVIHQAAGGKINRALAVINALVGSLDVAGGVIFGTGRPFKTDLGLPDNRREGSLWTEHFPLAKDAAALFTDAMLDDRPRPVRGLVVACGNPVSAWPDARRTRKALASLDLLVVNDLFPTETTALADVVLPGATFFEKGGLDSGPFKLGWWIKATEPLVAPPGQARPEWRIAAELARRLGCEDLVGYRTEDQVISRILADSGMPELSPRDLRRGRLLEKNKARRYLDSGFPTLSGRLHLFEDALGRPGFSDWLEAADACPARAGYPLRLITGARCVAYYHSQQRNVPRLKHLAPHPAVEISPQLAESMGVADGDRLAISTPHGRLHLPAVIRPGLEAATVSIPHGWPHPHNANELTACEPLETTAATPVYRALACRVAPVTR